MNDTKNNPIVYIDERLINNKEQTQIRETLESLELYIKEYERKKNYLKYHNKQKELLTELNRHIQHTLDNLTKIQNSL